MNRALLPDSIEKLLPEWSSQARIVPTQIILHTIVGSALGAYNGFLKNSNLESHLIAPYVGAMWQLIPFDRSADANYRANRRPDGTGAVSIETEDNGQATIANTPWTAHQIDIIVDACVYLCRTYGIPPRLCRTPSDPGIGYHTLFGAPSEWTPVAKSCPGAARIAQVPGIIARVAAELAGTKPTPAQPAQRTFNEGEDMDLIVICEGKGIWHVQRHGAAFISAAEKNAILAAYLKASASLPEITVSEGALPGYGISA